MKLRLPLVVIGARGKGSRGAEWNCRYVVTACLGKFSRISQGDGGWISQCTGDLVSSAFDGCLVGLGFSEGAASFS